VQFEDSGPGEVALFIDDGGVLNDNRRRRPEWVRLIGEFMPPRLGGTADAWAVANGAVVTPAFWEDLYAQLPSFKSHRDSQRTYALRWMRRMCEAVGVGCPPDDEAEAMHRELSCYVAERADAAIEGAAEAVRSLQGAGYVLHMASGTPSWELRGILGRMGILEAFSGVYGPDLIDHVKYGPGYYERIFADCGIEPRRALVIESDLECCRWAREAGAQAVCVDDNGAGDVLSLDELTRTLLEGA
jgi:phosphoglycolate phosphatase-like HAD superfamily hydrolase